jgi:hypothetical protein
MRTFWRTIITLSWLGVAACTTPPGLERHVVFINEDGQLVAPTNGLPEINKPHEYLTNLISSIATSQFHTGNTRQVMIFVHGGLNDPTDTLQSATNLIAAIQTNAYPIFVVWNSGLGSCYWDHLCRIRQGRVEPNCFWRIVTCPAYLLVDIGRGITRTPVVWYYQCRNDMSLLADTFSISQKLTPEQKLNNLKNLSLFSESGTPRTQSLNISLGPDHIDDHWCDRALRVTAYCLTWPFKLLTAPLIDAMGKAAWENMSRRTQTAFCTPKYYSSPSSTNTPVTIGKPSDAGLSLFFNDLDTFLHTAGTNCELTIIGHSMGAMIINKALRQTPSLTIRNIVYMAPACSFRDFQTSVLPYLHANPQTQFYCLGLHPRNERREMHWYYGEVAPLGSLLAWIDNYYTLPKIVPDLTLGSFDNLYDCAASLPTNVLSQLHFKFFPTYCDTNYPEGNPQYHGAFSETNFWEQAFWEPKKH